MLGASSYVRSSPEPGAAIPDGAAAPRPSTAFMRKGILTHKRFPNVRTARKHVMLCNPTTTDDLFLINKEILEMDENNTLTGESKAAKEEAIKVLGQIALSAVSGAPVLIMGVTNRQFIHFSEVEAILDEDYLAAACNFHIVTSKSEVLRFSSDSSIEYQGWITALRDALVLARSVAGFSKPSSRSVHGSLPRTRSQPKDRAKYDDFDYPESGSRSRGLESKPSRRYREQDFENFSDEDYMYRRRRSTDDIRSLRSKKSTKKSNSALGRMFDPSDAIMSAKEAAGGGRRSASTQGRGGYDVNDDRWETSSRMSRTSSRRKNHSMSMYDFLDSPPPRSGERRASTKKNFASFLREDD